MMLLVLLLLALPAHAILETVQCSRSASGEPVNKDNMREKGLCFLILLQHSSILQQCSVVFSVNHTVITHQRYYSVISIQEMQYFHREHNSFQSQATVAH